MRDDTVRFPSGWLLVLIFLLVYILPLGCRPLFIPDETRYAEIPREMLATGDWIVPRLNGLLYFEKPALGYWITALAQALLGENPLAVRLPQALAAGLTALVLFLLVKFATGSGLRAGGGSAWLAPFVYLTCIGVAAIANIAVVDSLLVLFLTVCLGALFVASETRVGGRAGYCWLALAGVACGCAFLTKGFLAYSLPILVMGPYLAWNRRWRDLLRLSWLPLLLSLVVILPWAQSVNARAPDFWRFFFWHEHVRRFLGQHAQHARPVWFYLLCFPLLALPWSMLVPAARRGWWVWSQAGRARRLLRFSVCWLLFPFFFFSLCRGKLPTYILPCFAPLGVLLSLGLTGGTGEGQVRGVNRGIAAFALLAGLLTIALVGAQLFLGPEMRPYQARWRWLCALAIGLGVILLLGMAHGETPMGRKLTLLGLAVVLLLAPANMLIPARVVAAKCPQVLLQESLARLPVDRRTCMVLASRDAIRAVCWYLRRDDVVQVGAGGELEYGLHRSGTQRRRLMLVELRDAIRKNQGRTILVARARYYRRWLKHLPPPRRLYRSAAHGGFVVAHY